MFIRGRRTASERESWLGVEEVLLLTASPSGETKVKSRWKRLTSEGMAKGSIEHSGTHVVLRGSLRVKRHVDSLGVDCLSHFG